MRTVRSRSEQSTPYPPPWERPVVAAAAEARAGDPHRALRPTFITTAMAGAFSVGADPLVRLRASIRAGFPFAVTLLLDPADARARALHARAAPSCPGHLAVLHSGATDLHRHLRRVHSHEVVAAEPRRALFDVGAAGPWAGLFVAIPAVLIGLHLSEVRPARLFRWRGSPARRFAAVLAAAASDAWRRAGHARSCPASDRAGGVVRARS